MRLYIPVLKDETDRFDRGEDLEFRFPRGDSQYDGRFDQLTYGSAIRLRPIVAESGMSVCCDDVPAVVVYVGFENGSRIIRVRRPDPLLSSAPSGERESSALPVGC